MTSHECDDRATLAYNLALEVKRTKRLRESFQYAVVIGGILALTLATLTGWLGYIVGSAQ